MSALWSRRGGGKRHLIETSRRNLFELHAGRQTRELPSKLLLDEISPVREPFSLLRFATSEDLIAALGPIGLEYKVDQQFLHDKVDISYLGDPVLLSINKKAAGEQAKEAKKEAEMMRSKGVDKRTLKGLLIQYLRHVDPIIKYQARFKNTDFANKELDDALLGLLNKENCHYLSSQGMDIRDLMTWTWVLTPKTTERAATRLLAVAHQNFTNNRGRWSIPLFLYLFLLRRRNSSAEALRSLLIYAWQLMEKSETSLESFSPLENPVNVAVRDQSVTNSRVIKNPEDDKLGIRERLFMIMVIRLLRAARMVWPAACNNIVALISRYLDGLNFRKDVSQTTNLTSEDIARLTYMYNTLLKLVALPASIGPYLSAFHQQRAQFSLLRRMNAFQPPLVVDRRGYQAVISVQLMHKKTLKEREWAQMKARSWPPWKEEKLGIDADIGVEHGTTRAMEALTRSWEAGYAPDNWDAVASVLSGWDTDKSPTIQTRAVLRTRDGSAKGNVWVSRIQATRTLDEAWSCFLSYKDQKLRDPRASSVYHEMFAKIAEDARRLAENSASTSTNYRDEQQPLPGDGIEVFAAPSSPREAIYVRMPPPTVENFVRMMAKDNIRPRQRFLSTMLIHAPSLEIGLQYLEASKIPNAYKRILSGRKPPSNPEDQAALESIPNYLLSSFIRFLTTLPPKAPEIHGLSKFALVQTGPVLDSVIEDTNSDRLGSLQSPPEPELKATSVLMKQSLKLASSPRPVTGNPLLEAIELVLARRPPYRPAWYHLLRALSKRIVVTAMPSKFLDFDFQDLKTWQMTCRLLNEMSDIDLPLDLEGFHILCAELEKVIFACERVHNRRGRDAPSHDVRIYADHVLSAGLPLLKQIFKDVVRSKSMQQEIPDSFTEEKPRINEFVGEQQASKPDNIEADMGDESTTQSGAFLPPGCLLPRLLEVPEPAYLHAFVRVLGLRRDWNGLLDLVEWMSLFADEIHAVTDKGLNGHRMMRRCLTSIRVFMERSWITLEKREAEARGEDPSTVRSKFEMNVQPAPAGIVKAVRQIVGENKRWGGWPEPHEVEHYCMNGIFK